MYTRSSTLYIAPCSCRAPCSDSHLCASPSKPSPSVLGCSSPRVGFPALFEVSRVDTLLESRFLFDDVNFCHLLFSRGPGTAGRGGDVQEPRGHSPPLPSLGSGCVAPGCGAGGRGRGPGSAGQRDSTHPSEPPQRTKLPSLCATTPCQGAPARNRARCERGEETDLVPLAAFCSRKLLLICYSSVFLVTTE